MNRSRKIVIIGYIADDLEACVLLDPLFHHGKHGAGDSVQYDPSDPAFSFFILRKTFDNRSDRTAHPPGIDDQDDRRLGLRREFAGGSLCPGHSRTVIISHDAFDHRDACPVTAHRACHGFPGGISSDR